MDELISKQAVKDQFKDWKQYKGICEVIDAVPTSSEELISKRYLYEMANHLESQAMEMFIQAKSVDEQLRWGAILSERTAFKNDIMDAPTFRT